MRGVSRRVLVLTLLLAVPHAAAAQAQCGGVPTPDATWSVDIFLTADEYADQRTALGIADTSVTQLQKLSDATFSSLCQRMNATFSRLPAFYYRAGQFIIGTNFSDSAVRARGNEFATTLFVFDSLGYRLPFGYPQGNGQPLTSGGVWTATASSSSGGIAANAFDGNRSTRWATGSAVSRGNTYFRVDMQSSQLVGSVRVDNTQFTNDTPNAGEVSVSTDGSNFTRVAQWTVTDIANGVLTLSWAPVPARYVQLVATDYPPIAGNWFSIGELFLYSNQPPLQWLASASASDIGSPPARAIDGDIASRWATGGSVTPNVTYFQVNTRRIAYVGSLRINNSRMAGDLPVTGKILLSTDGVTFTEVKQWTASNISAGILTLSWTPVVGQYVKIVATSTPASSGNWFSIGELLLWPGTPPAP